MAHVADRRAGQFAAERFDERNRAWLRRIWWALLVAALSAAVVPVAAAVLLDAPHMPFFWGLALGTGLTMALCLASSPPAHIEHWRQGAEGERRTARILRPLIRDGWVLINDIQHRGGNIDHVLIGPAGVFVLETKNLHGRVSVVGDKLIQSYAEGDEGGAVVARVGTTTRGRAAALHDGLCEAGLRPGWVHAVVVIWGSFEQRSVRSDRMRWIHGKALVAALRERPDQLDAGAISAIAAHVREHA